MSKRERLAGVMDALGLHRAIELAARRPGLLVVNYHRLGVGDVEFDSGVLSATPDQLRSHVTVLKARFRLLSLEHLARLLEAGGRFDRPYALVTFDDGYRDNFELAFPILRELEAPASFFIPTSFIAQPRLAWWDHIAYAVKKTRHSVVHLDYPECVELDLRAAGRARAVAALQSVYKRADRIDGDRFLGVLGERLEVEVDAASLGREIFMTWEQIRQMRAAGMDIGSHTHRHPILSRISEAEQRTELETSKRMLEEELGEPVEALAYPVGRKEMFTQETKQVARSCGYRLAFSAHGTFNPAGATDPLEIQRITMDRMDVPYFRCRVLQHHLFGKSWL